MKMLALIITAAALAGCASTKLRDPKTGVVVFQTDADADVFEYEGNGLRVAAVKLNHSDLSKARWNGAAGFLSAAAAAAIAK